VCLSEILTSLDGWCRFKAVSFAVRKRLRSLCAVNCVAQMKHWVGNVNPRLKVSAAW
jgi:hypothetical protein